MPRKVREEVAIPLVEGDERGGERGGGADGLDRDLG